jgi:hypothetical protein
MRVQLPEESEARDDAVIEIDQLGFCQLVDVDRHHRLLSFTIPLASCHVFLERRVHPRLPARSGCAEKRQHFV